MDGSAFNSFGKLFDNLGPSLLWAILLIFAIGFAFGSLGTWLLMR